MVLATLLLICSIPQVDDPAKVVNESPAIASEGASKDAILVASLPSAPVSKVKADAEPIAPNPAVQPFLPVKPVLTRPRETPRQRKIWYGLTLAAHSGAAFDAWSTHRAVAGGDGPGGDSLPRPLSKSNASYAATQGIPARIDHFGERMDGGRHGLVPK